MPTDEPTELEQIPGIGRKRAKALQAAGFQRLADLEEATEADLRAVPLIDDILARDIKATVSPGEDDVGMLKPANYVTPRDWTVTKAQVTHLTEELADLPADFEGATAQELRDRLELVFDPELLLFTKVCGRVVVHDSATGEYHPVPNATVHVEDTDCSFLSYFPEGLGYGWFFPYGCSREEIATVTTDECGRFCVLVPRWDIDRVRSFRRERICLPELVNPRLRDILENPEVFPDPPFPPRPGPRPDPVPMGLQSPGTFERVSDLVGERVLQDLDASIELRDFGNPHEVTTELLDRPAFPEPVDPPMPTELDLEEPPTEGEIPPEQLPVDTDVVESIDFDNYVGPFLRCRDVFVPEWRTFIDVPDITFRVTQDVDGDGTEETIYSEGYFDVRWNDTSIPDVDLVADEQAISIPSCEGLEDAVCDTPSIETVGLMPADAPYHDRSTGYSPRINKPKPPSGPRPDATAPYAGTLQLHGCHRFEEAEYYRVMYAFEGESERPFIGHDWHAPVIGRTPVHVQPDSAGWYPIMDIPFLEDYYGETFASNPLVFPYWLLNWNTRQYRNGTYHVRLDFADGDKNEIDLESPTVPFEVDNRAPNLDIEWIKWGPLSEPVESWDNELDEDCPKIERPAGTDIGFKVKFRAWSHHFRNLHLSAFGCDDHPTVHDPGTATTNTYSYWHRAVSDRQHDTVVPFKVPASYEDGGYRIRLRGFSRAFNPAGSGTGPGSDWTGDQGWVHDATARLLSITTK